jgi:SAM-dependent methyltransferase
VAEDERRLHASSFGAAATAYPEHRPDYAQAAVGWALEPAPGPRVLDLGAGTGKLTATLVALGAEVIAVEPGPAMLTELRRAPFLNPAGTERDAQPARKPTVWRAERRLGARGFCTVRANHPVQIVCLCAALTPVMSAIGGAEGASLCRQERPSMCLCLAGRRDGSL